MDHRPLELMEEVTGIRNQCKMNHDSTQGGEEIKYFAEIMSDHITKYQVEKKPTGYERTGEQLGASNQ